MCGKPLPFRKAPLLENPTLSAGRLSLPASVQGDEGPTLPGKLAALRKSARRSRFLPNFYADQAPYSNTKEFD